MAKGRQTHLQFRRPPSAALSAAAPESQNTHVKKMLRRGRNAGVNTTNAHDRMLEGLISRGLTRCHD